MKKFIVRLLIIIAITFVADRGFGYVAKILYSRTTTTDEYKVNSVIYRMDDPVVFMGSSRAHHHYIPSIIGDTLQTGVYNAGLWGTRNTFFQYALLCNILQRYTPKTICWEIHPIDYLQTPFSSYETVDELAPFVNYSPECDALLKKSGQYYRCEVSHLYRYNSRFVNLLVGLTSHASSSNKGYKAMSGIFDTAHATVIKDKFPYPVSEEKVHYMQLFIDKCKEKHIQLILLYSPKFAVEDPSLFNIPDSLARKNGIPFINHYNMEGITGHPEYFYDWGHLNSNGAEKYSPIIASELKQYIHK